MNQKQPDLNAVLNSPEAVNILKNKQALESLLKSGEVQRLMAQLNKNAGGDLKDAAQSAMKGDSSRLMNLVQGFMNNPQNTKLIEELNKKAGK